MDHEELRRRYDTPRESLSPEARRLLDETEAYQRKLKEEGRYGSPELRHRYNTPIGMDDNYQPFPVRDRENDEPED